MSDKMPAHYTKKPSYHILSERIIRNIITEFVILVILLGCSQIITDTVIHKYAYYSYSQMEHTFVKENSFKSEPRYIGPIFRNVQRIHDIWDYARYNFLYVLHNKSHHDGYDTREESDKTDKFPFLFDVGLIIGVPRIRQIRVKEIPCPHDIDSFHMGKKKCYPSYSASKIFKGNYKNTDYMEDAKPLSTTLEIYKGAGYSTELKYNIKENLQLLSNLKYMEWIDAGTRLVVIELNTYFEAANVFITLKLLFEILPTGFVLPSADINSINIHSFLNYKPLTISAGVIFSAIVLYYTYVEIREIHWIGPAAYFKNVYNYTDIVFLLAAYLMLIYNIWHVFEIKEIGESYIRQRHRYINMDDLITGWHVYLHVLGIMNMSVWLKPLRFISFHRSIQQVLAAVRMSIKSILGLCFFGMSSCYAFAQLSCIAFGQMHPEYLTELEAFVAQVRCLMNDISYTSLEEANSVLAPFFFVILVLVIYCIILNLFKAIYLAADMDVKKQLIINDIIVVRMLQQGFKEYLCFWRKRNTRQIILHPRPLSTEELNKRSEVKPSNDKHHMNNIHNLREQLAVESERCARIERTLEIFIDIIENIEKLRKKQKKNKKY